VSVTFPSLELLTYWGQRFVEISFKNVREQKTNRGSAHHEEVPNCSLGQIHGYKLISVMSHEINKSFRLIILKK
jgi:hypothetical protein